MVNVTVMTQSQRKCILRYTYEDYLAYITLVEVIPIALTLSFSVLKQLIKEGVLPPINLPNHSKIVIKFCTPLGQECQGSLPTLVAILTYFCSHCKLKIVSPVGVILQLTAGKGGNLTLVRQSCLGYHL